MKKLLFILPFILLTIFTYAQAITESTSSEIDTTVVTPSNGEQIDGILADCLKTKNQNTAGLNQCLAEALESWENRLSVAYPYLLSQINEPSKTNLKLSQIAWTNYKKAQFKFLEDYYGSMQGTTWTQIMLTQEIEMVKKRFEQLNDLTQD